MELHYFCICIIRKNPKQLIYNTKPELNKDIRKIHLYLQDASKWHKEEHAHNNILCFSHIIESSVTTTSKVNLGKQIVPKITLQQI